MHLINSPGFLLITTGSLLGLTFPLGKLGSLAGVHPIAWAFVFSFGAATGLVLLRLAFRKPLLITIRNIPFYCVSASVSLVLPNILTYSVITQLGSGFTALLFTLSPLFTLALSSIWQVRMPGKLGLVGIGFGFIGAVIIALTRGELGNPASIGLVLTGICIPLSLAIGNVYRTMAWPEKAQPLELAIGMNLASAIFLFIIIVILPIDSLFNGLASIKIIVLLTILVSCVMAASHSRLQFVGGPTYLSQIGYIAAGVALLIGVIFFNEQYSWMTWAGAACILLGAGVSIRAQTK